MQTQKQLTPYPAIIEVMALLDCGVIEDIQRVADTDTAVFALGDEGRPSVGLAAFRASPFMSTLQALDTFCAQHIDQYEATASEMDRTGAQPEAWFWSDEAAQELAEHGA